MRRLTILLFLLLAAFVNADDLLVYGPDCAGNSRARIASTIINNQTRTDAIKSWITAEVTGHSLSAIDPATFGLLANPNADNMVSVNGTAATSPCRRWVVTDIGRTIHIAGAGTAGAVHVTTIAAWNNAGSITLTDAAPTAITASRTSAAGLAVWGDVASLVLTGTPIVNADGSRNYPQTLDLSSLPTALVTATGGTTPRTIGNHFGDALNVKDCGAVGDGVTDDTAAIQLAVNNAFNVFVPAGTYKITGDGIQLRTNSRIYGTGPTSILKKSADTNAYVLYAVSDSGVVIENLACDGSRSYTNDYLNSKFCIYFATCTDSRISGVTCYGALADNIVIEYGKGNVVEGCHSLNCNKDGIYMSGAEDCSIVGNVASGCGSNSTGGGIAVACSWGCAVAGNVCADNIQFDILLSRASRFCTITGNTLGAHKTGQAPLSLYVLGEPMAGTLHDTNYGDGSVSYGANQCIITGNTATAEMRLELLADSVVSGNTITDSDDVGLWLMGCTRVAARGNRITSYTNTGIKLSSSAKNGTTQTTFCTVDGNSLYKGGGTAANALSKSGTDNIYISNTLNSVPLESGGTFVPTLTSNGTAPNITYTEQQGSYAVQGDLVFVRVRVTVNAVTSAGTGTLLVSGLPLQSAIREQAFLSVSRVENTQTALTLSSLGLGVSDTAAAFYYTPTSTGAASSLATTDALKAGFTFTASGCYRIGAN